LPKAHSCLDSHLYKFEAATNWIDCVLATDRIERVPFIDPCDRLYRKPFDPTERISDFPKTPANERVNNLAKTLHLISPAYDNVESHFEMIDKIYEGPLLVLPISIERYDETVAQFFRNRYATT
jgi:hypothetical protein